MNDPERELSPKQQAELAKAAAKFRRSMENLGLGVTIQVGDDEPVVVTEPPKSDSSKPPSSS